MCRASTSETSSLSGSGIFFFSSTGRVGGCAACGCSSSSSYQETSPCHFSLSPTEGVWGSHGKNVILEASWNAWCYLSSLPPPPPGLKRSSHLSLSSSWDHRRALPHSAKCFYIFGKGRDSLCCPGWSQIPELKNLPALASQSAGIIGVSRGTPPQHFFVINLSQPPKVPELQGKRRERVDVALSDEFLLPTDWEIPGGKAPRVTSVTLLASTAVLLAPRRSASQCGVYGTGCPFSLARLVPSPQGEQQLEALRTESFTASTAEPGKVQLCGEQMSAKGKLRNRKTSSLGRERSKMAA
ncbi:Histone demethylase UTY [Plecturocebus cupreus]